MQTFCEKKQQGCISSIEEVRSVGYLRSGEKKHAPPLYHSRGAEDDYSHSLPSSLF